MTKYSISPKQELFALNLFSGMTQYEAYINAGYSDNSSKEIVKHNAYVLATTDTIKHRLAELEAIRKDSKVINRNRIKNILFEILENNKKKGNPVAAADIISKLEGFYSDTLVDQSSKVVNIIVQDEETKKLLESVKDRATG